MKISLLLILVPLTLLAPIVQGPKMLPANSLNVGLIAYWKLDEASGTRADADLTIPQDLTDNNTVTSTTGKLGNCAQFTSANSESLTHADSTDLSVGDIDFTIAAWVQLTATAASQTIAAHWLTTSANRAWRLWYDSGNGKYAFDVSSDGTIDTERTAGTFGLPAINTWHFVVAWHDSVANTINICVNNGAVDSTSYSTGVKDSTATFDLGARGTGSDFLNGLIDEVGFWKKVLTAAEITYLYNSGTGRTCCPF